MSSTIRFEDVWRELEPDGGLRDIYALQTSRDHWLKFLSALMSCEWPIELRVSDQPTTDIHAAVNAIEDEDIQASMSVTLGTARLNCHFFCTEEIELDLKPAEIGDENFADLLRLVRLLGESTGRNAFVTEERSPECGIFAYRLETAEFELVRRPMEPDEVGRALAPHLARILARFGHDERAGDGGDVPVTAESTQAAAEWRALYAPNRFDWHTGLTVAQFRALRGLDIAVGHFFGRHSPEDLCRIGGFKRDAINRQFWNAIDCARSAFELATGWK